VWRNVRTSDGNPLVLTTSGANRVGTLRDNEAPYGTPVTYSTIESPSTVSSPVTVDETRVWLVDPGTPALSVPIEMRANSFAEESWDVQQGIFWPMGRSTPVVQTDGARKAPASSVTVKIDTLTELADLRALLTGAGVLLLNVPPSANVGVDTAYIAIGKVTNRRVTDIGADPYRAVELPYQVVDMPIGGSQSSRQLRRPVRVHHVRSSFGRVPELHRPAGRPVTARVNNAEGGTSGATVTTANSGGTSGDAWDSVSIPSGTTATFATAAAYKGSRGYRLTPGSGSGTGPSLRRSLVGWTRFRDRWYLRVSALPTVATQVAYVTNYGDTKVIARIVLFTNGRLGVQDASGSTVFTASAAISTATWYRIEWIVVPGTRTWNGTLRFAYAAGDGAAIESYASTSANTGTAGTLGTLYVGKLAGVWNANVDLDDFAEDDTSSSTFLGASAASGTPVVVDPTPPPGAPPSTATTTDLYGQAIRSSVKISWSVSATFGDAPVAGATDLAPVGGSITDTNKPGVRRVLNVDLAPTPGTSAQALFDLLEPVGTYLTVTATVTLTGGVEVDVPMGVFVIDTAKVSDGEPKVSITAPDKWILVQRSKFVRPQASSPGSTVVDQAAALISG
jgi:hypothetical protein